MRQLKIIALLDKLENAAALDPVVDKIRGVVMKVIQPQPVRDLLHGVPIGHPLHPLSVQVPIGAWTSAAVLDLLPGSSRASRMLVGMGVITAAPAIVSGYTDWSEMHEQQMRVGIVHSAGNALAIALYSASFVQRVRGKQASGKVLGYLGLLAVSGAGFLGGHLSYRQAGGANHAEEIPHRFPVGWQRLGPLGELPEDELYKTEVGGLPLLALRRGQSVHVLSNICSHLSGPLDEGELTGSGADACVSCPWHGSAFSVHTGEVVRGPATSPQPRFETRVTDGIVEVMLPNAG